jgi:endonuclease/exonuclease/phosphatase family metal-dependent hydrolase
MNIINLNTWAGVIKEPLIDFFEKYKDTDVFCLQEVLSDAYDEDLDCLTHEAGDSLCPNLYQKILDVLPEHVEFFTPLVGEHFGLACFVKKNISVLDHGEVMLYEASIFPDPKDPDADHNRKMQWLLLDDNNKHYLVMNVHGHWKKNKLDDADTLQQSKTILEFIREFRNEGDEKKELVKVLMGDFNVNPDTESVKMFNETMDNVVLQNGITTTRTSMHDSENQIIDYVFVSKGTPVDSFEILPEEVSDHVAMKVNI